MWLMWVCVFGTVPTPPASMQIRCTCIVLTPPASKFSSLRKVPPAQAISAMHSPLVRNMRPAGLK